MNRTAIRDRVMGRLRNSRLGWIGDFLGVERLGCRWAGCEPFADRPRSCRHCGMWINTWAGR